MIPFIDLLLLSVNSTGGVAPPSGGKNLYAWGSNSYGQLGDSKGYNLYSWQQVHAGDNHTLGLRSDGFLFAWGLNTVGQLGDGTTTSRSSPVQVGAKLYSYISAGGSHSVAIDNMGALYAWGLNSSGQAAGQSLLPRSAPTQLFTNYTSFSNVTSGKFHNIAVDTDGALWVWGDNTAGQLGDGTTISRSQPVQITFKENSTQFYPPLTTTTQYSSLTTPFSSNFDVGTGNFTVEFYIWVDSNPVVSTTGTSYVFYIVDNTTAANNWGVYQGSPTTASTVWTLTGSLLPGVNFPTNGFASLSSTYNTYGVWTHHAIVRNSGTFTWYVDGALASTITTAPSVALTLGPSQIRLGSGVNALVSNFRFIKGTAYYTAAFNPSSTPLTAVSNTQLLTLQNGQFNDNSSNNTVLTVYSNPAYNYPLTVSSRNPFPGYPSYSTYFSAGNYALIGSNTLTLLSQKYYTIEFYIKLGSGSGSGDKTPIIGQWSDTTSQAAWLISIAANTSPYVQFFYGPYSTSTPLITTYLYMSGDWTHIALTKNNTTFAIYMNGVNRGQASSTAYQTVSQPTQLITVGNYYNTSGSIGGTNTVDFTGHLTNLRIVASNSSANAVVYTSDFTAPTAPFNLVTAAGTNINAVAASTVSLLAFQGKNLIDNSFSNPLPVTAQGTLTTTLTVSPYSLTYKFYSGASAGETHSFVIDTNNKLYAFGSNSTGQLGDGTIINRSSPTQIGTGSWVQVGPGGSHTAAIDSSGNLFTWGSNQYGQLGQDTSFSPSVVWSKIHDGQNHFVGIKSDGSLWSWGFNWYGQLGDGTTTNKSSPVQIGSDTDWNTVSGGGSHTVATKTDGSMYVWGANNYGQLGRNEWPLIPTSFSQPFNNLYPAPSSAVVVKSDGTLWAWGDNTAGVLGDGTAVSKSSPVQIGNNSNWTAAGSASGTSYGITQDGLLYAWGLGTSGQLGDGTITSKSSPVLIAVNVSTAVIGATVLYYRDNANSWYATGTNSNNQMGVLDSTNRSSPVLMGATPWAKIAPTSLGAIALKADGTIYAWGTQGASGTFGLGDTLFRSSPVQIGTSSYIAIAAGENNAYAIKTDYTMWAWGNNTANGVGDGTTVSRSSPVQILSIGGVSWVNVIAGQSHAIALTSIGTMYTWGQNTNGQLGDNSTINKLTPVQVPGSWTNIYATFQGTFATRYGTNVVYGWGLNSSGQLGNTNTIARSSPVQVLTTMANTSSPVQINTWASWTQVAAGGNHTLALATTGSIYGWGLNATGQIGAPTLSTGTTIPTTGTSWKKIVAGSSHTVAIRSNSTLWIWGGNSSGQIGDGSTINRSSPIQIGAERQYTDVGAGFASTYALDNQGLLYAWGLNNASQLGLLDSVSRSSPVQVEAGGISTGSTVYSTFFNGSTDYLTANSAVAFPIGTETFTVEMWIYKSNAWNAVNQVLLISSTASSFQLWVDVATTSIKVSFNGGTTPLTYSTASLAINTWYHLAVVRVSSSFTMYLNGVSVTTGTDSGSFATPASIIIGNFTTGTTNVWNGYISNLRITRGQALYTSNFSPSTSPLTTTSQGATAGNVSLLTLQSSTFVDNSSNNLTITKVGGPYNTVINVPFAQSYTYKSWTQISGGYSHAMAIDTAGYLYTWGLNSSGQLGQSDTVNRSSPVQVGSATYWTSIQAGASHSVAIGNSNKIYIWGANNNGQLGQGDTVARSALTQLGTSSWITIASTGDHVAGITANNSLFTWGLNNAGQLGNSTTFNRSSPTQILAGPSSASSVYSIVLNTNLSNYLSTTLSKSFNASYGDWTVEAWVYLGSTGSSWCVISDSNTSTPLFYIQWNTTTIFVGDTASNPINTAYAMPLEQWLHVAVVRSSGTMYFYVNGVSRASTASSLANGFVTNMVIGRKGSGAYTFTGFISNVRIVYGTALYPSGTTFTPATSNLTTTSQGATASQVYLLTCQSGTYVDNSTYNNPITVSGSVPTTSAFIPFSQNPGGYSWSNVTAGYSHTVAQTNTNTLWLWGLNSTGQVLDSTVVSKSSPVQLTTYGGSSFVIVNGGGGFITAVESYNTALIGGSNANGELGDNTGTPTNRSYPIPLSALPETPMINYPARIGVANSWAQISAGYSHNMAIRLDGGLFAWGLNSSGQLGDGSSVTRSSPVQIGTDSWTSVSAGNVNTAGLKPDGSLYVWGNNASGQVGDNTTTTRSSPVLVPGYWSDVEVGSSTLYGTMLNKKMFGWGYNVQGQIGDLTQLYRSTPVQISYSNINYVSAQSDAGSAIDTFGNIYSWGRNQYGQLGNNTRPYLSWVSLNNGDLHSFALRNDGTLWAWGRNTEGQLGDGTTVAKSSPVQISGSWVDVSAGLSSSAGIKSDGTLYTWGSNVGGQLGLGFTMARSSPVQIESGVSNSNTIYSTLFNGSNDYLTIPQAPGFNLTTTTTPFTIEAWVYLLGGSGALFTKSWSSGIIPFAATFSSDGTLTSLTEGYYPTIGYYTGSAWVLGTGSTVPVGQRVWTHVAFVFTGSATKVYINGVDRTNATSATTWQATRTAGTDTWIVGRRWDTGGTPYLNGYVHSFRFVQGVAVYTGNFTVPTSKLTATQSAGTNISAIVGGQTQLLTCQDGTFLDNSVNNGIITGVGSVQTTTLQVPFTQSYSFYSWSQVSVGVSYTTAILSTGALYAWGLNSGYQVGDGTTLSRSSPVQIGSSSWTNMSSFSNSLIIGSDNKLYALGTTNAGNLGISSGISWSKLVTSRGGAYALAIRNDGRLFTWGLNTSGQLGDGTTQSRSSPIQIGTASYIDIAAATTAAFAIKNDYTLWSWGVDANGLLGTQATVARSSPVQVQATTTNTLYSGSYSAAGTDYISATHASLFAYATGNFTIELWFYPTSIATNSNLYDARPASTQGLYISLYYNSDYTFRFYTNSADRIISNAVPLNKWYHVSLVRNSGVTNLYVNGMPAGASYTDTNSYLDTTPILGAGYAGGASITAAANGYISNIRVVKGVAVYTGAFTPPTSTLAATQSSGTNISAITAGQCSLLTLQNATFIDNSGNSLTITAGSTARTNYYFVPFTQTYGTTSWTKIDTSVSHAVALQSDGKLYAWGLNSSGQLGDTTTVSRSSPVQIASPTSFNLIAAGASHTVATDTTGTLYTWGINTNGQLGEQFSWTYVGSHVRIRSDGTMWAVGRNDAGQLGDGTTVNKSSFVQIGTDRDWAKTWNIDISTSMAIKSDGRLYAWGLGTSGQIGDGSFTSRSSPVQVSGSWIMALCNNTTSIGIQSDGRLYTWGNGSNGMLGNNSTSSSANPTNYSGLAGSWSTIGVGTGSCFHAIKTDGTLWAWGFNNIGQLGVNDRVDKSVPTQISGGGSWIAVASSGSGGFAVNNLGKLYSWGMGNDGFRADNTVGGTDFGRSAPAQVTTTTSSFTNVYATFYNGWAVTNLGLLFGWGYNLTGTIGDGTALSRSAPVQINTGFSFTNVGILSDSLRPTAVGVRSDGTMVAWATNTYGEIGDNTTAGKSSPVLVGISGLPRSRPVQVGGSSWTAIGASTDNTYGIIGTSLYSWGKNDVGQVGDGTTVTKSSPVQIGTSFVTVTGGFASNAMAVKSDNSLWVWGNNSALGLLGLGDTLARYLPTQISPMTNIRNVSWPTTLRTMMPGISTTYAIGTDNRLYTWGANNANGVFGDGTTVGARSSPAQLGTDYDTIFYSPTLIDAGSWSQVSVGSSHSAAIKSDGKLYLWGSNSSGQLGQNVSFSFINAGVSLSMVVRSDGTLWAWGYNLLYGELGDNTLLSKSSPVLIGNNSGFIGDTLLSWSMVTGGLYNNFAIRGDGRLFGWGLNSYGAIGDGTTVNKSSPVMIGTSSWLMVDSGTGLNSTAGPGATYAIRSDGGLFVWGDGTLGQFGDGNMYQLGRSSPVQLGTDSWSLVVAGAQQAFGIKPNGTLWGWGNNLYGVIRTPALASWTSIAVGGSHTVALRSDGKIYSWGYNLFGQLGDGTSNHRSSPVQTGASTGNSYLFVTARNNTSYAIRSDYTLWSWGQNGQGELGIGDYIGRSTPTQVLVGSATGSTLFNYGNALSITNSSLLNPGTGNFTLECFVYLTSLGSGASLYQGVSGGILLAYDGSQFAAGKSFVAWELIGTGGATANVWTHIAVSRSGTTMSLYKNGTRIATGTISTNYVTSSTNYIGTNGSGEYVPGYISNLRLVIGSAVYDPTQTTITVPTATLTAVSNTALLTCQSSTFIDNSSNNFTITTIGSPSTTTAVVPLISGTLYSYFFNDTTNTYLSNASVPALAINNGDFTIEAWVYMTQYVSGNYQILHYYSAAGNQYGLYANATTGGFEFNINGTAITYTVPAPIYMVSYGWYHVAVTRQSGVVRIFFNGAEQTRVVNTGSVTTGALYIGALNTPASYFKGYINNLRVVVGTSLYNTNFTPTTVNLTAVTGTQLLTAQSSTIVDNSTNNITFTNNLAVTPSYVKVPLVFNQVINYASWTSVAAGVSYVVGTTSTGALYAWGINSGYQLGDGTTIARSSPVQISVGNSFTKVSAFSNAMAIASDGKLWGWGQNASGVLGIQPVSWSKIAAGLTTMFGIRNDGTLWGWGYNGTGLLGQGDTIHRSSPVQIGSSTWLDVSTTKNNPSVIAIRSDYTLWAWGYNLNGALGDGTTVARSSPVQITSVSGSWIQTAAAADTQYALQSDGKLWGVGSDANGQLAQGPTVNRSSLVQIYSGKSFAFVGAGGNVGNQAFGIEAGTGYLWAWGYNVDGQLGDGTTTSRSAPVQIGSNSWTIVISSVQNTYGLVGTSLYGWGNNASYQIGDGTSVNRSSPVLIGSNFALVDAGWSYAAAVKTDGTLYTWGINTNGQLGNMSVVARSYPTALLPTNALRGLSFKQTYKTLQGIGSSAIAAIGTDNRLYIWGTAGAYGLFADSTISGLRSSPVQIGSTTVGNDSQLFMMYPTRIDNTASWSQVSVGDSHVAAIRTDGSLYTWGVNTAGQLGNNASFIMIKAGYGAAHAIRSDNTLWGWGYQTLVVSGTGLIGDGSTISRSSPVQVFTNGVIPSGFTTDTMMSWSFVAATNQYNSAAIRADGRLQVWGGGIIGDNTTVAKSLPVNAASASLNLYVNGVGNPTAFSGFTSFTQVAVFNQSTYGTNQNGGLAIRSDGALFGWGDNYYGQLAQGTQTPASRSSPVQLNADSWISITTATLIYPSILGIKSDRTLWVWGRNDTGQLGVSSSFSWSKLDSSGNHALAIRSDGKLFAWGLNTSGQVGDNSTGYRSSPVQIASGSWINIAAGASASAAVRSDNSLWVWGANSSGELGLGDTANRSVPIAINATVTYSYSTIFNGTNSQLSVPANAVFAFGTNDFTIEFWINASAVGTANTTLLGNFNAANWSIVWNSGNIYFQFAATTERIYLPSYFYLSLNAWYHIALTRQSNILTWWVNGVAYSTLTSTTSISNTTLFYIGAGSSVANFFTGFINNLRITTGQALFTGTFTPATSNLTTSTVGATGSGAAASLTGTVQLLTLQSKLITDISSNNFTITNGTTESTATAYTTYFESPFVTRYSISDLITPETSWSSVSIPKLSTTQYTLALKTDGSLWAWGNNIFGTLGDSLARWYRSSPIQIGTSSWTSISAGSSHAVGIINSSLYGWGNNTSGQLGLTSSNLNAVSTSPGALAVSHYIDNLGRLWGWAPDLGANNTGNTFGIVGDGTTLSRSSPVQIGTDTDWKYVVDNANTVRSNVGRSFITNVAAIKNDGRLFVWGDNQYGGIGDGTTISRSSPVQISGSWTQVSIGSYHILALKSDSTLYAWGNGSYGAIGNNATATSYSSPYLVGTGTTVSSWSVIAAGGISSYAIDITGRLFTWGYNDFGQLGQTLSTTIHRSSPIQVGAGTFTNVFAATGAAWAISNTGAIGNLYALGGDNSGAVLGDNSTVTKSSPVVVGSTLSFTRVYAGNYHVFAVTNTGSLYAWGNNAQGQLGDGTVVAKSAPTLIDSTGTFQFTSNIVSVAAGGTLNNATLIAASNGTSAYNKLWGAGRFIPDNTTVAKSSPVIITTAFQTVFTSPVLVNNSLSWSSVSAGATHTVGITSTGSLYAWGTNASGQIGIQPQSPVQLSINHAASAILRPDGQLLAWQGSTAATAGIFPDSAVRSAPTQIGLLPAVGGASTYLNSNYYWKKVSMGSGALAGAYPSYFAIRNDNILFGWGFNTSGQVGDGTTINRSSPVQIGTNSWIDVSIGFDHALAIKSDGTLWAWGNNNVGQLGDNTNTLKSSPIQIGTDANWTKVLASKSFSLAVNSGSLFTWGFNSVGQLGLGDTINRSSPVNTSTSFNIISSNNSTVVAIKADGTLWGWGTGANGELGLGLAVYRSAAVQIGTSSWVSVASGGNFTHAVDINGALYATGSNDYGQLGDGTTTQRTSLTLISQSSWSQVSAGLSNAVAYRADLGLYAWGYNLSGNVGDGTTVSRSSPVQIGTLAGLTGIAAPYFNPLKIGTSSWTSVRAGADYTIATLTTGALFTWGLGTTGQLANGATTVSRSSPVQVGALSYNIISAGNTNGFAHQSTTGQLFGWGLATSGQLGDSTTVTKSSPVLIGSTISTIEASPVQIPGSWMTVSTTSNHTIGIKMDGTLYTWGANTNGSIGDGTTISRSSPVQISGSWTLAAAGSGFAVAQKQDGTLWAWGYNLEGELGQNNTTYRSSPVQVGIPSKLPYSYALSATQLVAGPDYTITLLNDGSLYAWGNNAGGQLGLNDVIPRSLPVQITTTMPLATRSSPVQIGTNSWSQVSAGTSTTLGIQSNSNLYAWGLNTTGQLGNMTTVSRSAPMQIPVGVISGSTKYNYLFNGTNANYISVTGNNNNVVNFILGTADFTIEFWHFPTASTAVSIYDNRPTTTNGMYHTILYSYTTLYTYTFYTNTASQIISPASYFPGFWNHVALVRISGITRMYVNGMFVGAPFTDTNSYITRTNPIIGGDGYTAGTPSIVIGNLQDFRIVKGIGVYTGNFLPPTTSLTNTQSSGTNIAAIPSNTSYSVTFDGTGDYLTIPDNTNLRMTGDFTVEAWVYRHVAGATHCIASLNSNVALNGYAALLLYIGATNTVFIGVSNTGTTWQLNSGTVTTVSAFAWTHIAVVRSSGAFTIYINGVGTSIGTVAGTLYAGTLHTIGVYYFSSALTGAMNGYISNLRYANVAVYTGNFTTPTGPLSKTQSSGTNIAALTGTETQLLICQNSTFTDNSNNAFAAAASGNVSNTRFNPFDTGATILLTAQSSTIVDNSGDNVTIIRVGTVTPTAVTNAFTQTMTSLPVAVSTALSHTAAVGNSLLTTWGLNATYGQLGDGTTVNKSSPVQLATNYIETSPVQIAGSWTTIAVTRNTTALTQYPVVAGIKSDGSLWTWGYNVDGAVGDGTTVSRSSPIQLPAGVVNSNTVYSVGFNGSTDYLTLPTNTAVGFGTGDFTIEMWMYQTALSATFGTLYDSRPAGTGSTTNYHTIGTNSVGNIIYNTNGAAAITGSAITLNTWYHVAVTRSGNNTRLFLNGVQTGNTYSGDTQTYNIGASRPIIGTDGNVPLSAGYSFFGFISNLRAIKGQALYTGTFTPATSNLTTSTVGATGAGAAASITGTVGLLMCQSNTFIDNSSNNFTITITGTPVTSILQIPFTQSLTYYSWSQVKAGYDFAVAVRTDGTVWSWGLNTSNQLGDGTATSRSSPTQVRTTLNASSSIQFIATGFDHTIAVATDGTLYAWGNNPSGAYGTNNITNSTFAVVNNLISTPSRSSPIQIGTSSWSQISSGLDYTTAITTSNRLFVWGVNTVGLQGTGTAVGLNTSSPVQINTSGSVLLTSAGFSHRTWLSALNSYVILGSGLNTSGQLGDVTAVTKSVPVLVSSLVYDNALSSPVQLGSSANANYGTSSPVQVGSSSWTLVRAGQNHTLGVTSGTLYTWGQNNFGQLGDSTTINRSSPVQVTTSGTIVDIEAGATHNVIEMSDGTGFAFGNNNSGQLGDGS